MPDIFQQRYYRYNKFFFSLIGQWPYQSRWKKFFMLAASTFLAISQITPQIIAAVEFRDDPDVISESLPPFLFIVIFGTKFINIVVNSNKMLKILQRIEIDWISIAQQPEMYILHNYAEEGRKFTIAYPVGVYFMMVIYMGQPFIPIIQEFIKPSNETVPKVFPFPVDYYSLDPDTYYFYMLAYMIFCNFMCLLATTAADTMFVVLVQHACGMFTVVGHQLQRMANDLTKEYVDYSRPQLDPAFRHLIVCIRKHNDVIEFTKLLETLYTWSMLSIVGVNMLEISVTGLQVVWVMDKDPKEAACFAVLTIAGIGHLLFVSFYSQKLINHSQQIGEYLCQAEWYRTSLGTQKLVNLVTMRARVPCQLTAGKFIVISLENFTMILKTSLSYFSVMRSMR